MRVCYKKIRFNTESRKMIGTMNAIIDEYVALGYRLTVRQLYYQLVARDVIPNKPREYQNLTRLCSNARIAGLMDWDVIEDRTRDFITVPTWKDGSSILRASAAGFAVNMWDNQPLRVYVIVEKEAMTGVLSRICAELDVPMLAARGYPSVSVLHEFVQDVALPVMRKGQEVLILHLGDHDPSGMDMTRDLEDRIEMFSEGYAINLRRIALNMDQIAEQSPPPNPAKVTDSRFKSYQQQFGDDSWELDALNPTYISDLVRLHVEREIDTTLWQEKQDFVKHTKVKLDAVRRICFGD